MNLKSPLQALSRRRWFAGAGAVGAVAAVAAVAPQVAVQSAPTPPVAKPKAGGGYQLSEHNKRYYQTTRV